MNYKVGEFFLDSNSRSLIHQSRLVRLSPRAFDILLLLIKNQGQVVGKDTIIDTVWRDSFVEENNLAVHISALRRVLKEKNSDKKYIETISGRGYRLLPPVKELESGDFSSLADLPQNSDELHSIAILPFTNKSGDSKFDYLAEGITQSLILNLSPIAQLKVIAYSAVSRYQNQQIDLQEIGFLLGVEAILTGQVIQFDETLEINVELTRVNNLSHLWGTHYQCRFEDFLKTRAEISTAIADKLQLQLTKAEIKKLTKQPTESYEAYKLYLKGWNLAEKRTQQGLLKSIECFNEALKIDPGFALAYAGIAEAYFTLGHFYLMSTQEAVLKTQDAIQKALKFDENLSEAHSVNGLLQLYSLDFRNAEKSFQKAIESNPNSSIAHSYYSIYLVAVGNFQLSLFHQYESIELNPFILARAGALSTRFYLMREYSKSIKNTEEVMEVFSNNDLLYLSLAFAQVNLGMFNLAIKNIQISYEMEHRPDTYAHMGFIYAISGNKKESLKILNEITNDNYHKFIDFCDIAVICGALGDNDKAFEYLEKAYQSKFSHLFLLKVDARFDSLRSDPRFEPLLKRIGLA